MAACRQKRRVRFITAAGLVNELVEAKHELQLRRVMARWSRYDLIAIDEVGYVPLAEVGAEFLFQARRACREPRSYSGDGHGILSLPPNRGKTEEEGSQDELTAAKLWKCLATGPYIYKGEAKTAFQILARGHLRPNLGSKAN